jgi:ribosomal protein S27E
MPRRSRFTIKQNDRKPFLRVNCLDENHQQVTRTSTSAVRFLMRSIGDNVVKVDAGGFIITEDPLVVEYRWLSGDSDTVGVFEGEFEVTYTDSTTETFPNGDHILVRVTDDVG